MDKESIPWIYDIADGKQRINITLRIWAGCLDAAKNLHDKYVSRRNDGTVSEEQFFLRCVKRPLKKALILRQHQIQYTMRE
jgi:hypothetical protein